MEPWSGYIVAVIVIVLSAICWRLFQWWRESTSGCLPFTRHLGKRREDEARYCRLCLLVLNIGSITLRRVINNVHLKQGPTSFEAFLDKHKDKLFHLAFKRCCCANVSNKTPMNRSQWEQLFRKTGTAPLHRHHRGDCPCQYKAVPGVVCDVMDITLSCLIIRNLCTGVSMTDVETIREERNNLIHANSSSLDEATFNARWNSLEAALLSLASSVSPQVEADTKTMLQELKQRIMNNEDLMTLREQLEKLKKDVKALQTDTKSTKAEVEVLKRDSASTKTEVSAIQNEQKEIKAEIRTTSERVTELENDTAKTSTTVASQSRQIQGLRLETRRLKGKQTEDFPGNTEFRS